VHPPPSAAWANFTLMMECTPESSRCYSVYSVVSPFSFRSIKLLYLDQVYLAKMARSSAWRTCCPGWQARKATPASPAWRAGRASRVYLAWPARMADRAGKAMWDQLGPTEYQVKKVIFRIFFCTFSAFLFVIFFLFYALKQWVQMKYDLTFVQ